ncbi:hypothetical protein [Synoicihabitans lomoniglobus]|uniref:Uncharacterized protein n=1 Tax=Synoicihabitans lomoniglobus TaxID=2909285 RepID=A0AAF0CHJ3_9BACT|nr:hypothetical protein [Opitutaceae bacterium LMO-M01]WED64382.1 hypothetical protein PXH66_18750 [Opitutaceae bacterium LMO-M01]
MKFKFHSVYMLLCSIALGTAGAAEAEMPELALVIVPPLSSGENIGADSGAYTDFDRLDLAFQKVAEQRHWPVKIVAERLSATTAPHELELRVYLQPVRRDRPEEFTFRGWMTLHADGTKHDLNMIISREQGRYREDLNELLDKLFYGAAEVAARKIEPILFPQLAKSES